MKTFTENNFDELFKERFSNFGENPPEGVLQRIKNTMSNIPVQVPFWKKGGFYASIGSVIILISGILVINSFVSNPDKKDVLANNVSTEINTIDNSVIENKTENNTVSNNANEVVVKKDQLLVKNESLENVNNNETIDNGVITKSTSDVNTNKSSSENNNLQNDIQPNVNIIVTVNVKAATCRRANGTASLSANDQSVKFFWSDIDSYNATNIKDNLQSGSYNVKAVNENGIEKHIKVIIPDSGIIRTRFTHYEMTQAIGVPVYFSNKTTVDGVNFEAVESITFKWYFGDGSTSTESNPEYLYKSTGPFIISLAAYNSIGCRDSICSSALNIAGSDIDFPNIFTPNGDGISDVFKPAVQGLNSFYCVIFNRDGKQIFEFTDPELGWDGKINNGLQLASPGTYYYIITGVGVDGKFINHKQFLNINY